MEGQFDCRFRCFNCFIKCVTFISKIHYSTIPKLRQECELRMITDHLDFLHSDCKEMVSQEKRVDLHNMYVLLKPIPDGLKTLIQAFLDHIKNEGIETISTLKGETVSNHQFHTDRTVLKDC